MSTACGACLPRSRQTPSAVGAILGRHKPAKSASAGSTKYSRRFRQTRAKKRIWMRCCARSRNCLLKSGWRPGSAIRSCSHCGPPMGRSASRLVRLATREFLRTAIADFAATIASGTSLVLDSRRALSGALRRIRARPTSPRNVTPRHFTAQAAGESAPGEIGPWRDWPRRANELHGAAHATRSRPTDKLVRFADHGPRPND